MTDTFHVHDIEDTRTTGYLRLSRQLGEIRVFCLRDTRPQNLSPQEAVQTLHKLLGNVKYVHCAFSPVFSGEDSGAIQAYLQRIASKLMDVNTDNTQAVGKILDAIYRESTELRASLGIFRMTIPVSG
jgi:hypothetical protein